MTVANFDKCKKPDTNIPKPSSFGERFFKPKQSSNFVLLYWQDLLQLWSMTDWSTILKIRQAEFLKWLADSRRAEISNLWPFQSSWRSKLPIGFQGGNQPTQNPWMSNNTPFPSTYRETSQRNLLWNFSVQFDQTQVSWENLCCTAQL